MNQHQKETLALLNITTIPGADLIVPRRGNLPEKLTIEIGSSEAVKLLVAGQRGMGKTTELRRLVELLKGQDDCLPVFLQFGSQETISEVALITAMAEQLAREPEAKLESGAIDPIRRWHEEEEVSEILEEGYQGEAGVGGNYIVLTAKGQVSHKRGKKTQKRAPVIKNKRDLLAAFNSLLEKARKKSKKRVVFVIDDIDKVQNANSIQGTFIHGAQLIGEINAPCVFTVPITYATSTYLRIATLPYNGIYRVPAVPLFNAQGAKNQDAYGFMEAVFGKRMPFNPLAPAQLARVLEFSGGVLVDSMRMLRGICKDAILNSLDQVPDSLLDAHFQDLVDDYKYVFDSTDLWSKLSLFCNSIDKSSFVTDESMPDLLYKMIVIEYRESQMWFDLHPAARKLYEQNKQAIEARLKLK